MADRPTEPVTRELPAADPVVVLTRLVENIGRDVSTIMDDQRKTNLQMANFEMRLASYEGRPSITSDRVKAIANQPSQPDLENEAKIAGVLVWRANVEEKLGAIETKIDTKTNAQTEELVKRLNGVLADPIVKKLGYAAAGLLLQLLAAATTYLALKGH